MSKPTSVVRRRIHAMAVVRRMCQALTLFFAVSAFGDVVTRSTATPALAVAFQPEMVMVTGATPGATVVLFALAREPLHYASHTRKLYFSAAADAAGTAQFALPAPVVRRSIYAAVDLESGSYAIATPDDYPVRVTPFPASALKKRGADFELLDVETARLDAICVRPRKRRPYLRRRGLDKRIKSKKQTPPIFHAATTRKIHFFDPCRRTVSSPTPSVITLEILRERTRPPAHMTVVRRQFSRKDERARDG